MQSREWSVARTLAGSIAWPSSYRDLMDTPYHIYCLVLLIRSAESESA